ncbi:MAG: sigma factor, partial [Planctomycetota bacterium]
MTHSDELPLEELLAHGRHVHTLASQLVFDAHLARDVEQEVLLAALAHRPRDGSALRAWLGALVRNFAH